MCSTAIEQSFLVISVNWLVFGIQRGHIKKIPLILFSKLRRRHLLIFRRRLNLIKNNNNDNFAVAFNQKNKRFISKYKKIEKR